MFRPQNVLLCTNKMINIRGMVHTAPQYVVPRTTLWLISTRPHFPRGHTLLMTRPHRDGWRTSQQLQSVLTNTVWLLWDFQRKFSRLQVRNQTECNSLMIMTQWTLYINNAVHYSVLNVSNLRKTATYVEHIFNYVHILECTLCSSSCGGYYGTDYCGTSSSQQKATVPRARFDNTTMWPQNINTALTPSLSKNWMSKYKVQIAKIQNRQLFTKGKVWQHHL